MVDRERVISDFRAGLVLVAPYIKRVNRLLSIGADPELSWAGDCVCPDYEISPDFADHFSQFGTDGTDACFEIRPGPEKSPKRLLDDTRSIIARAAERYTLSVGGYSWPLGGHLHAGFPRGRLRDLIKYYSHRFARILDRFMYPLMILSGPARIDTEYFTPSNYREQSYGLEYRSPGSQWLIEPESTLAVYKLFKRSSALSTLYLMISAGGFFDEHDERLSFFKESLIQLLNHGAWPSPGTFPDPDCRLGRWNMLSECLDTDIVLDLWLELLPRRLAKRLIRLVRTRVSAGPDDNCRVFAGSINENWGAPNVCRHKIGVERVVDISEAARNLFPELTRVLTSYSSPSLGIRVRVLLEDRPRVVHISGFSAERANAIAAEMGVNIKFDHLFGTGSGRDMASFARKPELQIYPHPSIDDWDLARVVQKIMFEKASAACKGKVPSVKVKL